MTSHVEQTYQERILKVLVHIQTHLDDELSLEELASVAYFSPFHFHRIFTAITGESIKSHVRRLRLARAARDLVFTDLSIMQISERAGYDTQQSFHRAFKETYSETPKLFRDKKLQDMIELSNRTIIETPTTAPVEIKTIEPITVAFVRHVGGAYDRKELMKPWIQLMNEVGMQHLLSDKTMKISIALDAPDITPDDKLRYDACVTLDGLTNFKSKGNVGVQQLRGGKYAVMTHYGAVEKIDAAYQILFGVWLPKSGYEPADHPNFIVHRKIPFVTAEKSLETDIYLPLKN